MDPHTFERNNLTRRQPFEEDIDEYHATVKERQHNLGNLNKIVSRLIKKGCVSQGT